MRCPSCGANADGAYCEYCGTKMAVERAGAVEINAENVTVNNYYGQQPPRQQPGAQGRAARQVDLNVGFTPVASPKSRTVALLLCVFLGYFGAHRFYARRYLMGVVCLFTVGLLGIGWLVDIVLVALGRMRDGDGLAIVNW